MLRSFGAFPISPNLVSRKRMVVERDNIPKFGFWVYFVYIGYFSPLSVQGQSDVIQCISDFRKDYIVPSSTYLLA